MAEQKRKAMIVYGLDSVEPMLESDGYLFKLLANDTGIVLFPHTTEHRDVAQPGIKYADDSGGNALAAMVKPGRIDFRFHVHSQTSAFAIWQHECSHYRS